MHNGLLVAAVTLAALPLQADSREDWRRKPPGRFHVGPFWVTPRLELRSAGVDTNVYNDLVDPVADTAVVLRPGLRVALPVGRRLRLQGNGWIDLNYFRRERDERSTDFGGDGQGALDVGPFTASAGGGGDQNRQRPTIDLDERLLRQQRFAFAGVDWRLGRATELRTRAEVLEVRHEPSRFTGADFQRGLDRNGRVGRAELRYDVTALTTLVVSAEGLEDTFVHERGPLRLTRSWRHLAGFDFREKAMLTGSVRLGLRDFPGSSAGTVPSYRGLAWKAATSASLGRFGVLRLLADRDVHYATRSARTLAGRLRNTYVSQRSEAGVDTELPARLTLHASMVLQRADYVAPLPANGTRARRVDVLYAPRLTLLRDVTDTLRLGATVGWSRRVSNLPGLSYQGWRYGLSGEVAP